MDKKLERGMRTMDFDSINYFLSICTSGSFSEAAKWLYISQPTLSRRITALEDELGTELFSVRVPASPLPRPERSSMRSRPSS